MGEEMKKLVQFTRWCMDPRGRTPVTINPDRVDAVEHWDDACVGATGEKFPAACVIIMRNKQAYTVQGSVAEVTLALNVGGEK